MSKPKNENKASRRGRGRPSLPPDEGKRIPLNMRTTKELRGLMEAAAAASGRSVAQEVELRLERSFWTEEKEFERWGGRSTYALLRLLAHCAMIIRATGKGWNDDADTSVRFLAAAQKIMKDLSPKSKSSIAIDTLRKQGEMTAKVILEGGMAQDMLVNPHKQGQKRTLLTGALVPPKKK